MVNYSLSVLACNMLTSSEGIKLFHYFTTSENPASIPSEGINYMDYILNSLGTQIILLLLLLDTIRSLIAAFGIVPPDTKFWGRVIYGKREKDIIKSVLMDMGYTEKEAVSSRIDVNSLLNKRIAFGPDEAPLHLLHIISCCISKYDEKAKFGDGHSWKSNYYINTMGIVHQQSILKDLADLLMILIQKQSHTYDFFIVPKGGNPILAQEISTAYNIPLIIAKDRNDTAKPYGLRVDKIDDILFEGISIVLNKVDKDKRKLRGAIIDCNAAGGGQIISIVEDFNDCINMHQYQIEPITESFVLFKLTQENDGTDLKFKNKHCTLFRYFDLSEDDKEAIFNSGVFDWEQKSGTRYDRDHMGKLESVFNTMKEQNRVKMDNSQGGNMPPTGAAADSDKGQGKKEEVDSSQGENKSPTGAAADSDKGQGKKEVDSSQGENKSPTGAAADSDKGQKGEETNNSHGDNKSRTKTGSEGNNQPNGTGHAEHDKN